MASVDDDAAGGDAVGLVALPDLLAPGLALLFIGLNPSEYSARAGHYFANPRNRFWPAFSRSALAPARSGGASWTPAEDARLLDYGIGFTDVVRRATPQGSALRAADYRRWAPELRRKLLRYAPGLVCFHGLMAYKAYLRYAENRRDKAELGMQPGRIAGRPVFVTPNPSPANARYSLDDLAEWYNRLAEALSAAG